MLHANFEYYSNEDSIRRLLDSDTHPVHVLPMGNTTKFKWQVNLKDYPNWIIGWGYEMAVDLNIVFSLQNVHRTDSMRFVSYCYVIGSCRVSNC